MRRTIGFALPCLLAAMLVALGVSKSLKQPRITMAGNGGKCSLSSHQTFRMKLTGWQPGSTVRIKVYYADGSDYPFPLRNGGLIRVDSSGGHTGPPWPCWPNKTCSTCGVSDKKEGYIVLAAQQSVKPSRRPVYATATFMVVP
jgi:hypothetical protein